MLSGVASHTHNHSLSIFSSLSALHLEHSVSEHLLSTYSVMGTPEGIHVNMTHTQPQPSQLLWLIETEKKKNIRYFQSHLTAVSCKCYKVNLLILWNRSGFAQSSRCCFHSSRLSEVLAGAEGRGAYCEERWTLVREVISHCSLAFIPPRGVFY